MNVLRADNVQFVRGNKAYMNSLILPQGTLAINLEQRSLHVHDGVQPGGVFSISDLSQLDPRYADIIIQEDILTAIEQYTDFDVEGVDLSDLTKIRVLVDGIIISPTTWSLRSFSEEDLTGTIRVLSQVFVGGEEVRVQKVIDLFDIVNSAVESRLGQIDMSSLVPRDEANRPHGWLQLDSEGLVPRELITGISFPTDGLIKKGDHIDLGMLGDVVDEIVISEDVPEDYITVEDTITMSLDSGV